MTTEHPITPPLELVREWAQINGEKDLERFWMRLATQAARWGADQELEACVEWLVAHGWFGSSNSGALCGLRAARRPKPPSLAEEALNELDLVPTHDQDGRSIDADTSVIRRALDRLKELENNG